MSNPVDLRFWRAVTPTPGAVELRFGNPPESNETLGTLAAGLPAPTLPSLVLAAVGAQRIVVDAALAAALPAPTLPTLALAAEQHVDRATGDLVAALPPASLPALTLLSAAVDYDQALPDAVGPGIAARAQQGATLPPPAVLARHQTMRPAITPAAARAQQAAPLATGQRAAQQQMIPASRASAQRAQQGLPLGNGSTLGHADMLRQQRTVAAPAQHGIPLGNGMRTDHQERIRFRHRLRTDQQQARPTVTHATAVHQDGLPSAIGAAVRQQQMIPVPLGWWQIAYPWPEPPADPNAPSSPVHLRFCRLADGTNALIFGCPTTDPEQPGATIIVPVRRTYIVLNTITLVRASDGAPIDATALTIGFDCDSWLPTFSATIPENMRQLVMPGAAPVEVVATVNGTPFHFLVETIQRTRQGISERAVSIGGRGVACELGAPYAPTANYAPAQARTAQQLVDDALQFTGYTQTWGLVDWLVPGGVFSMTGTPADVAAAVANAAGGVLAAHWSQRNLRMLPRYPVKPWDWPAATPDIVIPSAAVQSEGVEWQEMPDYDVVYVSGTVAGVTGQVKRAGTAGGKPAPMVADQLITHADAARQRGTTILSNTGRKAALQISLPVLPETGVIDLCKLVEFTDGSVARRGIVRANQISVAWPSVRQTLTIEAQA